MNSLIRPRLFAAAALLLVLGGASYWLGTANAEPSKPTPATKSQKQADRLVPPPSGTGRHDLILGSKGSAQPKNMEQFLTAVTKDVDAYWTKVFKDSGPAGAEGQLQVDPGRPDRGERLRRRGRHARRQRRRVLPGRRHDLHLGEVRDRHLQRRARPGAPRQLAGLRQDGRRLLGRLHRRARVRPRGPGRARPLRPVRRAAPDDGVRAPGRLLRRHVGQERLRGEPPRGRRRAGGARRRPRRRRLRHRPTRATTARPSSARRPGTAASSRATRRRAAATWTRPTSATAPRATAGPGDPQAQDPSYPGDGTGYGLRQQQAAYEHRGVAAVRG